jgi:hypothetical protein
MSDQNCGNCRYFAKHSRNDFGFCRWAAHHPMPEWTRPIESVQYDTEGRNCPAWQAKEDAPS